MAYVSKETKKELAPAIKKVLAEYGVKGTIKVNNYSTLVVTLRKVPAGLFTDKEIENGVNVYHLGWFDGTAKNFLMESYESILRSFKTDYLLLWLSLIVIIFSSWNVF